MRVACFRLLAGSLAAAVCLACDPPTDAPVPTVTPDVRVSPAEARLGGLLQTRYRFVVASGTQLPPDCSVFVHFLDADGELLWSDDHHPPAPTSEWRADTPVVYTRELFVPKVPYVGETRLEIGLVSDTTGARVPLAAVDAGRRSYQVARFQIRYRADDLSIVFADGWHAAERVAGGVEWRWSQRRARLSLKNPRRDAVLYLELDQPVDVGPQEVQLRLGGTLVDSFMLRRGPRELRKVHLAADQFGPAERAEMLLSVDKVFVPATRPDMKSQDARELGIRVFHVLVEPG